MVLPFSVKVLLSELVSLLLTVLVSSLLVSWTVLPPELLCDRV
jgi:hypothetical protein